jgi:hypothetical protein
LVDQVVAVGVRGVGERGPRAALRRHASPGRLEARGNDLGVEVGVLVGRPRQVPAMAEGLTEVDPRRDLGGPRSPLGRPISRSRAPGARQASIIAASVCW